MVLSHEMIEARQVVLYGIQTLPATFRLSINYEEAENNL